MDAYIRKVSIPRAAKVEEFDYFSEGVGLNFNGGQDRHKTKIGALVSVAYLAAMIYFFVYFLTNSLDTESPKVQYSRLNEKTPHEIRLLPDETYIFFLIGNPYAKIETAAAVISENIPSAQENIQRRRLAGTGTNDIYLTIDEFRKAFEFDVTYTKSEVKLTNGVYSRSKQDFKRDIVECSKSNWFNRNIYQDTLKENPYLQSIIKTYGICLKLQGDDVIFGDSISQKDGKVTALIRVCNVAPGTPCQQDYVDNVQYADDQIEVIVGAFQNTVNNSNKEQPFSMSLNLDNSFKIDNFGVTFVNLQLRRTQVITTDGTVNEVKNTMSKGAIDSVTTNLAPKLSLTTLRNVNILDKDNNPQTLPELDTGAYNKDSRYLSVQIVSSRITEQYSRKYDNLFDFFGNFGGAMEFVTVSFTILYVWYEEHTKKQVMKESLRKTLSLSNSLVTEPKSSGCLKKKNANQGLTAPGSPNTSNSSDLGKLRQTQTTSSELQHLCLHEEFDDLLEAPVSYEEMAEAFFGSKCLFETMMPAEMKALAPVVYMLRMRKAKEELAQQKTSNKQAASGIASENKPNRPGIAESLEFLRSPEFAQKYPHLVQMRDAYVKEIIEVVPSKDWPGSLDKALSENSVTPLPRNDVGGSRLLGPTSINDRIEKDAFEMPIVRQEAAGFWPPRASP